MVEGIFWSIESWGSDCPPWTIENGGRDYPPVNADEIINTANGLISEYIADHRLDLDERYDFDDAFDYSRTLWYGFCSTGYINGITAIYEEDNTMTTTYAAILYRHEAHITRPTDKAHILSKINADLGGDQEGETLGRFATEDEAIACAKAPNVSPVLKDAWGSGMLLLWGSTEVVRIDIDEDGEEVWNGESSVIQYPTPEELVSFVIDKFTPEEEEEAEEE